MIYLLVDNVNEIYRAFRSLEAAKQIGAEMAEVDESEWFFRREDGCDVGWVLESEDYVFSIQEIPIQD